MGFTYQGMFLSKYVRVEIILLAVPIKYSGGADFVTYALISVFVVDTLSSSNRMAINCLFFKIKMLRHML